MLVSVEATKWKTADGLVLHEHRWKAAAPRGVVALVHGFIEHGGRYAPVAERLVERGYAVAALDLRGHGLSEGDRAFVHRFDDYLADVDRFLATLRNDFPHLRLFLLGHSMGGLIAAECYLTRRPPLTGLILTAPAVTVGARVYPLVRKLAAFVAAIFPRLRILQLGGASLVSRNPEAITRLEEDPLIYRGRFPVRTGAEILSAGERLRQQAEAIDIPLLILHGTSDLLTNVSGSEEIHRRASSPDKTLKVYEGLYHELFSEPEREAVLADFLDWLDAHTES